MIVSPAPSLPDVLLIEPKVFGDDRGFFFEAFNAASFAEATGLDLAFVQDNHSRSARGVLRGLHYQVAPRVQGKLLRVVVGSIFDVAVDVRAGSPTFGQWVGYELSAGDKRQIWVPGGFAHGFLVTSDHAEVLYKTTDYYAPDAERAIAWDDPVIGIDWPLDGAPILSDKDRAAGSLADAEPIDTYSGAATSAAKGDHT